MPIVRRKRNEEKAERDISNETERGILDLEITWKSQYEFIVQLLQARDLLAADSNGKSDPFAIVYLSDDQEGDIYEEGHEQTRVHKETLEPNFGAYPDGKFTFELDESIRVEKYNVLIKIEDDDVQKSNDFLGGVTIPVKKLIRGGLTVGNTVQLTEDLMPWEKETNRPEMTKTTTVTKKFISYRKSINEPRSPYESNFNFGFDNEPRFNDPNGYANERRVEELLRGVGDLRMSPSHPVVLLKIHYNSFHDELEVYVRQARHLPQSSQSNGYVCTVRLTGNGNTLYCRYKNGSTVVHGTNPWFAETFTFKGHMDEIRRMKLVLEIFTSHQGRENYVCGVTFPLNNVSTTKNYNIPLHRSMNGSLPAEEYNIDRYVDRDFC